MHPQIEFREAEAPYFALACANAVRRHAASPRQCKQFLGTDGEVLRRVRRIDIRLRFFANMRGVDIQHKVTKASRIFEREAKQTLEHSRRAVSLVHAIARQEERPLNVGISTLTDLPRLHRIVEQAQRSVAELSMATRNAYTPELVLGILRGTLDAAIVDLPVHARGLSILPLGSEAIIAAVFERHLLASRTNLQLADLAASPWVLLSRKIDPGRMAMERSLQATGIQIPAIQDAGNLIELLDYVALGTHVALVRNSVSRLQRSSVLYKPIADAMQMEYAFLWRTDNRSPRLLALRDAVYAFCQKRPSQEIVS